MSDDIVSASAENRIFNIRRDGTRWDGMRFRWAEGGRMFLRCHVLWTGTANEPQSLLMFTPIVFVDIKPPRPFSFQGYEMDKIDRRREGRRREGGEKRRRLMN
jgi:hypothetical protein